LTEGKDVILTGDFYNLNLQQHPIKIDGNGKWYKAVMLSSGKYECKSLMEGQWRENFRNDETCPNCFGRHIRVFNTTVLEKTTWC